MPDLLESLQEALGTRYRLEGELGRGGMATVYRAFDLKLSRPVAIKVLAPELATAIGAERFKQEITLAATLNHPNIVPLFDAGGAGDLLYYTMPVVDGESLRDRLERQGPLPLPMVLSIGHDVALALDHAHERGIVHRDIKPENILLQNDKAVVADFGIARSMSPGSKARLTEQHMVPGTVAYMSPEQCAGAETIDGRADIYALACVLYELVAGEPPFVGSSTQAVLAQHLGASPPPLQQRRSQVAPALAAVIARALAKRPADRYPTARAFVQALDAAAGRAHGVAPARVTRPAGLVAALAVALVLGIGWLAWRSRAVALDANSVVVFPLASPGFPPEDGVGARVALMIGSALEHTEPLRFIDGERLVTSGPTPLTAAAAGELTRRAGARYFIDGAVVGAGDSVRVIVRLTDASNDSLLERRSAADLASAVAPHRLALRAIGQVLPALVGAGRHVDLRFLSDRQPLAIAAWLQGEREYARSQYVAAMAHMHRAIAADSSMAVAALKGAQAAVHLEDQLSARGLVTIALRHRAQLPVHHQSLAQGLRWFLDGDGDSALAWLERAERERPDWNEPAMMLGETYYHLMPGATELDSLAEVEYRRAVALDSAFAPALFHLTEFATRHGELANARRLMQRFAAVSPDSDWTEQLRLTVDCASHGPDRVDWAVAVRRMPDRVVNVARVLGAGGAYPACARAALASVIAFDTTSQPTFRWSAVKGLGFLLGMMARDDEAFRLLDSVRPTIPAVAGLYVLGTAAGLRGREAAAESVMASLEKPFREMGTERLWYFTIWLFHRGERERLDSAAAALAALADTSAAPGATLLAHGSRARALLLHGDTAGALLALRNMRMVGPLNAVTWSLWASAALDRALLAELLLATGDARGALRLAAEFDSPRSQVHALLLPKSLMIRRTAAARLGQAALRDRIDSRLRALGRSPPP